MNVTHCDRIAYYVAGDGQHVTIPVTAGRTPDEAITRHGRTYTRLLVGTPTGEDAGAVMNRAILQAVREADEAGELAALLEEAA
jgi:hypothetical protein